MSRHGRRPRQTTRPVPSSSSGTPTPAPAQDVAEIVELELKRAQRGDPWETYYGPVVIDNAALGVDVAALVRYQASRRTLEALGFVFPAPGEAFGEMGGLT